MKPSPIPPIVVVCVMINKKLVRTGILLLFMSLCGYVSYARTDSLLIRRPATTGKTLKKADTLSKERLQYRAQMLKELQQPKSMVYFLKTMNLILMTDLDMGITQNSLWFQLI